jgi:hypothetical protein
LVASADDEVVVLRLTRGEFKELIAVLQAAEETSAAARKSELDFRLQWHRLERMLRDSEPPGARRESTRYVEIADLGPKKRG